MNPNNRKLNILLLVVVFCSAWGIVSAGSLDAQCDKDGILRVFMVEINFFSYIENQPVESFQSHGSGTSSGGCCSWGVSDDTKNFRVSVSPRNEKGSLTAVIGIVPEGDPKKTIEKNMFNVDLTDLKAKTILLTRNDDGRCYVVSICPTVDIIDNKPKKADAASFGLDKWAFDGFMVIFNDSQYVGKLSSFGGPMAYVSYPGIAKVTFSLMPFDGSQRLGVLSNGAIQISNTDGQTLEIYNVKNGYYHTLLPGGPYEVWANWQNLEAEGKYEIPSKDQWIKMVKERYARMAITLPSDEELDKMYEKVKNERNLPMSSGVGKFKIEDIK